jgi:hypothetical protein
MVAGPMSLGPIFWTQLRMSVTTDIAITDIDPLLAIGYPLGRPRDTSALIPLGFSAVSEQGPLG